MALTKADLSECLVSTVGLHRNEAMALVEHFFEEIIAALEKGEEVKLSGFGNFCLRNKEERMGRNPKTGELAPILARRVVTFTPGHKLKEEVKEKYQVHEPDIEMA